MRILVTGSSGFIGSYLLDALADKHRVLGVDKKSGTNIANFERFALTVSRLLGQPEIIVHLAAQTSTKTSIRRPRENFDDNVLGTFNVCEYARITGAKLIYTSSRKRDCPYGVSKEIGELLVRNYHRVYGVEYISDRLGNIYGKGQRGSPEAFWLSWFVKAKKENLPITIYGFEGKQSRDMLYIEDLKDLLIDQIENFEKYKNRLYKVGGGRGNEISLIEALKILKYDNYSFGKELPGDVKRLVYNNKLVSSINGWKPKTSIRKGIKELL